MTWLMVGLGNPGERYRRTRHNLGWEAVTAIAKARELPMDGRRFRGLFGGGRIDERRVFWLLPETYMNLAGEAVAEAVRFYRVAVERVVVFHDDLDLAPGRVKIKRGGGNAGHNGLRSIQERLGSADFVRVRLGIGRPTGEGDAAGFVLAPFTTAERETVDRMIGELVAVIPQILDEAWPAAMNRLGAKPIDREKSSLAPPGVTR